ncbi:MAG: hypothetical protein JWP20_2190 [Roseomonas sp.]|jgi:outer membrane biogenesis lipoprotein LolB|nr:hypothetical protein [Roseomonas sp.]
MKPLSLSLILLLGACTAAAPRSPEQRQQDSVAAACRQDVERTMRYRDRGQLMRTDEADSRLGTAGFSGTTTGSMSTERLSAQFEQDRLTGDCVRRGTDAPAPAPRGGGARGS